MAVDGVVVDTVLEVDAVGVVLVNVLVIGL
jgi:hypothetical protein